MAGADPARMSGTAGQVAGRQVGDDMMREAGVISVSAWDAQTRRRPCNHSYRLFPEYNLPAALR